MKTAYGGIKRCFSPITATSRSQSTDAKAVLILVEFIKHPGIDMIQLSKKVKKQSKHLVPAVIEHFLQSHDLLKKLRMPGDEVLDTI